jgi:hypothetical protein
VTHFNRRGAVLVIGIFAGILAAQQPDAKPGSTPEAALAGYKSAIEGGHVVAAAELTAGSPGVAFRKLAGPWTKAKAASDRLDRALAGKPELNLKNPLTRSFAPFVDMEYAVVEASKEGTRILVRIKYGPRGKGQEEVVGLVQEGGTWRLDPPGDLAKSLRRLNDPTVLEKRVKGLGTLAEALDKLAGEIEAGKLKNREEVLARLAVLVSSLELDKLLG